MCAKDPCSSCFSGAYVRHNYRCECNLLLVHADEHATKAFIILSTKARSCQGLRYVNQFGEMGHEAEGGVSSRNLV
jgi:hypothetical protein